MSFPNKVFFVTSHGMAGDPWFDWLPKVINSHNEILVFIGESVRSKYFKERSRKERPNIKKYCEFLYDVGSPAYKAVGECFGYRAYQLEELDKKNINVPWVNVQRHPYAWLEYYVKWRVNNMNMERKYTSAIEHEWEISWHEYFRKLKLKKYNKSDIHIWASYQGMTIINRMLSDKRISSRNFQLEELVSNKEYFSNFISKITNNQISFENDHLDLIFSQTKCNWRDNDPIIEGGAHLRKNWDEWKVEAFDKIVSDETKRFFIESGYSL